MKAFRDLRGALDGADQKGYDRGLEKGLEKGLKKGKQEEKLQIARNMKAMGLSMTLIQQSTNLTEEELQKL
jgi:predicted transposase/invertase (TIGR01784 family)